MNNFSQDYFKFVALHSTANKDRSNKSVPVAPRRETQPGETFDDETNKELKDRPNKKWHQGCGTS